MGWLGWTVVGILGANVLLMIALYIKYRIDDKEMKK